MSGTDRQRLIDQLIIDEDLRLKPYVDTVGKITIGCGRNLSDKGISHTEAMMLLDHDLDEAITDLAGAFPWFLTLDAIRQRACCNLRFNLGPTRFRGFKKFLAAMAAEDYPKAASELRRSRWYGQVGRRGPRLVHMILEATAP